jgi:hypothetical protein
MFTVCFVGLPHAGKSSIVNALAGRHLLRTGACRTTSEPQLVAPEPSLGIRQWHAARLESDDGVPFRAIDLPGIADAETEALSVRWARECDVAFWVSDVNSCFSTTHEKAAWECMLVALKLAFCQTCVVLTKCESTKRGIDGEGGRVDGELVCDEEATLGDCIVRAKKAVGDARLVLFSAFGRVVHRGASAALLSLVKTTAAVTACHTRFDLKWAPLACVARTGARLDRIEMTIGELLCALRRRARVPRPAFELEFIFCVAGARVCLALDASSLVSKTLLDEATREDPRTTLLFERGIDAEFFTVGPSCAPVAGSLGVLCAPRIGDAYTVGSGRVCIRTDDAMSYFDAYRVGCVTSGLASFVDRASRGAVVGDSLACPFHSLLLSSRGTTVEEMYEEYKSSPVQGPMSAARFRGALISICPSPPSGGGGGSSSSELRSRVTLPGRDAKSIVL